MPISVYTKQRKGSSKRYNTSDNTFPGQPHLTFNDTDGIQKLLLDDLWAADLETISPHLWIMSTQSSANINPLHRQLVKGRRIVVTEDPRLHLVWVHDRIFIKPLPEYLLSPAVWSRFFPGGTTAEDWQNHLRKPAMGFLRTYRHLIKHESDLRIAHRDDLNLVPKHIGWAKFHYTLVRMEAIQDRDVSQRYLYGELRLARLNFYAPFLLRRFHYEDICCEYSQYFTRFYAPIIFGFTLATTILNSFQVVMAVDQVAPIQWSLLWPICRLFSVSTLIAAALLLGFLALLWGWFLADEWIYALRCRYGKMQQRRLAKGSSC